MTLVRLFLSFSIALVAIAVTPQTMAQQAIQLWGTDLYGSLNVPTNLPKISNVAAGFAHTLALTSDGTVIAWGEDSTNNMHYGQTIVPEGLSNVVSIAAGYANSLALQSNGNMVCWGLNPLTMTGIKALAAGVHNVVLKNDGTVFAWGVNGDGECNVPTSLTNVVAIGAGPNHTLAVKSDGSIVAWGKNNLHQTNVPAGLSNVIAVAGGDFHSVALKQDGTVVVWGDNRYNQMNIPPGLSNVVAIASGWYHTIALKADKTIVTWGYNVWHQLDVPAGLSNVIAIAASDADSVVLAPSTPIVSTQAVTQTAILGDQVTLSIVSTGTQPLFYQWWFNETNPIVGATNSCLVLTNVELNQTGVYTTILSNYYGSATSTVSLFVYSSSQTILFGSLPQKLVTDPPFDLTATASSGLPVNYESSDTNIATVNGNTVTIVGIGTTIISASQVGNNIYSPAPNVNQVLIVNGISPSIAVQPTNYMALLPGQPVVFEVTVSGTSPLKYQWFANESPIFGATNATLNITNVQVLDMAGYTVIVTNIYGSVTSSVASLFVIHSAVILPTVLYGFVVHATITDGGYGYTTSPVVRIVGGGGCGAEAVATVSNGVVTRIIIINAGFGYTDIPIVAIAPPFPLMLGITPATCLGFTNLTVGTNYQLQVSQSGTWADLGSSFVADAGNYTQYFDGAINGSLYRLMALPIPYGATASPILAYGFVVAATVDDGGSGYVSVPAVQIVGGGGNGAQATATVINGAVTAIIITNAGFGYTDTPIIQIDPPPVPVLLPSVAKAFRLDYSGLTPALTYQLQAATDLTGWTNNGAAFTATANTNSQYLNFGTGRQFFRLSLP